MSQKIKMPLFLGLSLLLFNLAVQVYKDPLEILKVLPITGAKTINQTWRAYKNEFYNYATPELPAEFIASLAQVESSGDAWAQPGWRLKLIPQWNRIYSPASSAFGLMQITYPTLQSILRLCRIGAVVNESQREFCKSGFHSRLSPSSSIAMTSINLNYSLKRVLSGRDVSPRMNLKLAAVIHLCGAGVARRYLKANGNFKPSYRCGSHRLSRYLKKVFRNFSFLTKNAH